MFQFMHFITAVFPWTPAHISTELWLDAHDAETITESGGLVSQWDDKSGNANHVIQAIANSQPTYTASDSGLNNRGTIGYEPSATNIKYLVTPTITSAQAYIVAHWQGATFAGASDRYLMNSGDPNEKIHGKVNLAHWDTSSSINGGSYYRDGATSTTNDALPMTSGALWRIPFSSRTTTFTLMNDSGPNVAKMWNNGAIGEIIFTDGLESLADQQKIEGYLAWKWGFEGSLPGGHPYQLGAPTL